MLEIDDSARLKADINKKQEKLIVEFDKEKKRLNDLKK